MWAGLWYDPNILTFGVGWDGGGGEGVGGKWGGLVNMSILLLPN